MIVSRGDQVVCNVPFGSSSSHESHSSDETASLELSSREPLRFYVTSHLVSNDIGEHTFCRGFELLPKSSCRQLFERTCTHEVCNTKVTTDARIPGSGTLKGKILFKGEPAPGSEVAVGSKSAYADENAAFVIEAGPGEHQLVVGYAAPTVQEATVTLGPAEDVEILVAIGCNQVDDSTCCKF